MISSRALTLLSFFARIVGQCPDSEVRHILRHALTLALPLRSWLRRLEFGCRNGANRPMLTIRSPSFLLQEAILMHQRGAISEAAQRYSQILSSDPKNIDALCLLGMALGQQGRFAEAAHSLRKTVKLSPKHAAAHNLLGVALRELGRSEEALRSFERAFACQPDFREPSVNAANLLMTLGRPADSVKAYDRLLALKPDLADIWSDRGVALEALGRAQEALESYDRAINANPSLAEAHANRGNVLAALEQREQAIESYDRAIAAKGDFVEVHINRGNALRLLGRFEQALASYERAIALRDDYAEAHFSRGLALEDLCRFEAALASYDRALALQPAERDPGFAGRVYAHRASALDMLGRFDEALADCERSRRLAPDDPGVLYRLAFLELLHGHWRDAWPKHERRIELGYGLPSGFTPPPCPMWAGEPPDGALLVLRCEQGAGDRIQFCCFVPHLAERGYRVVLWSERFAELLQTVRGAERVVSRFEDLVSPRARWLHMMSLPHVLGTTPDTVPQSAPYLAADPSRMAAWGARVGTHGFKVGIAWQGNRGYRQDRLRSIPLAAFAPLAEIPGVRLMSLQKGYGSEQVAQVPFGDRIEDLGADFDTGPAFLDTAAAMMHFDLVISPNTAIAHLAGALGRPVFVALNQVPDWRWLLGRDTSPWYPTARLFRQSAAGDWEGVFARIASAVRERADQA
jgi:tetratricopeptide (TPR) repeat protein